MSIQSVDMSIRSLDSVSSRNECRIFRISRSLDLGYGFVAGDQHPTIVKHVNELGPSYGFLCAGDAIVAINGVNVEHADRDSVIAMVKECEHEIEITIKRNILNIVHNNNNNHSTINNNNNILNSQTLNRRDNIKLNGININNNTDNGVSPLNRSATLGRNHRIQPASKAKVYILRIFLENGQTKTFQYDDRTTVRDVLKSLNTKLGFRYRNYFGLAVDHVKRIKRNQLHVLDNDDSVSKISQIRDAADLRILYRVTFPPADVGMLQIHDPAAFEYLYQQTCNDVKQSRYLPELKSDVVFKLVTMHIVQHVKATYTSLSANNPKIILKTVAKDPGLSWFVPQSILASTKPKQLTKVLLHYIKKSVAEHELLDKSSDAIKLLSLEIVAQLASYGAKLFLFQPTNSRILINDRLGVSLIEGQTPSSTPNSVNGNHTIGSPISLTKINQIRSVKLVRRTDMCIVELSLVGNSLQPIKLSIANEDSKEFITTLRGYYRAWQGALSGNPDIEDSEYDLPIHATHWDRKPEDSIDSYKERSITPMPNPPCPVPLKQNSLDNSSTKSVTIDNLVPSARRMNIHDRSDDSEDINFPPPPPSMGKNNMIPEHVINNSINGSQIIHDDIGTISSLSPEDASVSLEDNSSARSDFPSEYPEDEHIYANTLRSFPPAAPGSHNGNSDERLHIVYRNKLGYDRTSTPSSSISGNDVTDLTNHRQIQINLDKDRHIIIKQYDVTTFLKNPHTQPALVQRHNSDDSDIDLNDFLTDRIMPPPPSPRDCMMNLLTNSELAIKASTELLSDNDIRSLIAPPPPDMSNEHRIRTTSRLVL